MPQTFATCEMFRFDRAAVAGPLRYSHGIARFRAGSVESPPPASAAIGTAPPRRASTRTASRFIVPPSGDLRLESRISPDGPPVETYGWGAIRTAIVKNDA